jgi:RNase P/RNase MRP subunit POP5
MKPLLPTLKEKKRYIAYTIHSTQTVSGKALLQELRQLLGLFDSAAAGLQHITFNQKTGEGVFRTSVKSVPKVRAALTLVKKINNTPVRVVTTKVSGILNKVKTCNQLEGN